MIVIPLKGSAKREYQKQWVASRRAAWIRENGPCKFCGSDNNLEVDHIDPKTKTLNPSYLWSLALNNALRIQELAKCQVLCETCHQTKTNKYRADNQAHGLWMYAKFKCRCDVCVSAKQDDNAKYRK